MDQGGLHPHDASAQDDLAAAGVHLADQTSAFEDRDVRAGHRYGYRLAIVEGTARSYRGETWLAIAEAPRLALGAPYPNPSPGAVDVPFALPWQSNLV